MSAEAENDDDEEVSLIDHGALVHPGFGSAMPVASRQWQLNNLRARAFAAARSAQQRSTAQQETRAASSLLPPHLASFVSLLSDITDRATAPPGSPKIPPTSMVAPGEAPSSFVWPAAAGADGATQSRRAARAGSREAHICFLLSQLPPRTLTYRRFVTRLGSQRQHAEVEINVRLPPARPEDHFQGNSADSHRVCWPVWDRSTEHFSWSHAEVPVLD